MKTAKIYLVTNTHNNKHYVGVTITSVKSRWSRHVSDSKHSKDGQALHAAIRKYGKDSFTIQTIYESDDIEETINTKESHFIKEYKTHGSDGGYNMTYGGDGWYGMTHTPESKKKMSAAHSGKTLSKEHKAKLSKAIKKQWNAGKRKFNPELIELARVANTGRKKTEQEIEKIRLAQLGSKRTQETRDKQSKSAETHVYTLISPDNKIYSAITNLLKFCIEHNLDQGNMSRVCDATNNSYKSHKGWSGTKQYGKIQQ